MFQTLKKLKRDRNEWLYRDDEPPTKKALKNTNIEDYMVRPPTTAHRKETDIFVIADNTPQVQKETPRQGATKIKYKETSILMYLTSFLRSPLMDKPRMGTNTVSVAGVADTNNQGKSPFKNDKSLCDLSQVPGIFLWVKQGHPSHHG